MSDVAMSDAAPAAPESVETANPVSTEGNSQSAVDQAAAETAAREAQEAKEQKAAEEKDAAEKQRKPLSTRDALKKAAEKVEAEAKAKTEPVKADPKDKPADKAKDKPEPKATESKPEEKLQPRTERGQFAAKEGSEPKADAEPKPTNFADAPQRFSPEAKGSWKDAPEPVRAEIHRAVKELEQGYQKHRADAEAYAAVKPFAEMAQKQGTTLQAAMQRYVGMEQRLRTDFMGGLEELARNRGTSLRAIAAQVMGQKPEESASRQDATIGELRNQVRRLQEQVGGVSKTIEQQRSDATLSSVQAFAAQPGHERFDELASDIKFFLETGRTSDLAEAYTLADRLNPGPAKQVPKPATVPVTPTAQTRAGTKSISGAPSQGSAPAKRGPAPSIRDALKRAHASAG